MRTSLSLLVIVGTALVSFTACGTETNGTCEETLSCGGTDGGGDVVVGNDGGADVVQPPAGCDPTVEPKDAPKCVVSDFGVFVDATGGADSNPGTKESPVKTIGGALGKLGAKNRVYVCEGTYAEHLKLTSAVSVYGGFACGAWGYSGTKTKIAPADAGYALEVVDAKGDVTISDLSLLASDATDKGQSSIAMFVHGASNIIVLRDDLSAGNGKDGENGVAGTTGAPTSGNLNGNAANLTTAGPQKMCTCASGGTSTGGGGGAPMGAGAPGIPSLGGAAPVDGVGGLGSTGCVAAEPNGSGNSGADATNATDGPKVTVLGSLDVTGWKPQAGTAGPNGTPGQGGGGGGGRDTTSAGGGGGCGGCGGTGGKAGSGGGASVALLSLESAVVLRASTLMAKAAGAGGKGGDKGIGASGGSGANGGPTGCSAGDGGKGGNGGTGSGGAGGVAVAVLHKGSPPTNEGSTLTPGTKGLKGTGGTPGTNDGPDGQQGEMLQIQ